ncbi:hypothetical protein L484_005614 [Morus notabilis]|uniref:Uncharacterized protein n=1 Tax=Morus notabilis TaxID=981085 RepID=W9SFL5_9ROSA|nr:hypothetical protein L484_005614 [Morus notabilis]
MGTSDWSETTGRYNLCEKNESTAILAPFEGHLRIPYAPNPIAAMSKATTLRNRRHNTAYSQDHVDSTSSSASTDDFVAENVRNTPADSLMARSTD